MDTDKVELIDDFMGYNSGGPGGEGRGHWVGDLLLECEVDVKAPKGELVLELSKGVDRFQAHFDLASGDCTLYRLNDPKLGGGKGAAKKTELDRKKTPLTSGTHRLRFANVDQQLLVWVDDDVVAFDKRYHDKDKKGETFGVPYDGPQTPGPTVNDLEPASIGVRDATVQVKHLKLWRDTYYTIAPPHSGRAPHRFQHDQIPPLPEKPDGVDEDIWKELNREDYRNPQVLTMYVQPDHLLCMGDNSPHSADSRNWGLVPRRLLLGRALTVYYPFYFPFWPLSSQVNRVGLIH
jgi:signal peptidase I